MRSRPTDGHDEARVPIKERKHASRHCPPRGYTVVLCEVSRIPLSLRLFSHELKLHRKTRIEASFTMNSTKRNQARLRLVVDNSSDGYRSGRSRWRETPETASMGSTRSAGMRPDASQPDTVPCDLSPRRRARALWPPTASQASLSASIDMPEINAQTVNLVNANSGNARRDNRRMGREPARQPSEFWKRLEETLRDRPLWQPVNANHVAKRLGMSQGSVYRWFTGEGLPELDTALDLAAEGGVCVTWLLRGTKPKFPISSDPVLRSLFDLCEGLSEDGRKEVLRSAENEKLRKEAAERAASESAKKRA